MRVNILGREFLFEKEIKKMMNLNLISKIDLCSGSLFWR